MTGFGKVQTNYNNKTISIEIKSLNSKQADLNLRLPSLYRSKDINLRNQIISSLERGKIDCFIHTEYQGEAQLLNINPNLFTSYYKQLETLAEKVGAPKDDLLRYVLQIPEISRSSNDELSEEESDVLINLMQEAIEKAIEFREQEGEVLAKDLRLRIKIIGEKLLEVDKYEGARIEVVRERIQTKLAEVVNGNIDSNRLEQELIFYIEKLDVTEEKIRLKQHLDYFLETMELPTSQGKKLGFIAQEIGREINTLGSKSNEANMQKIVVEMKDELEKIKEQLLNVL
ncbi:MAG: hypothetical protein H6Q15_902 [Bacteroidetes bacterium]|nr:hypothetical protein [Bacteroidota bacterium]